MFVTAIIIAILIIYASKGFKDGAIRGISSFVGLCLVIYAAFMFKTPISEFMYSNFPFFDFGGAIKGLTILNIILYEMLAFVILASLFMVLYTLAINATGIIDRLVKLTVVLNLPLKIIGIIVGLVEGLVITFALLFVAMQIDTTRKFVVENKCAVMILRQTPILSDLSKPIYDSLNEIYTVAKDYKKIDDKNEANLKSLDILLKYKILDPTAASNLVYNSKLNIEGAKELVDKYQNQDSSNVKTDVQSSSTESTESN